MKLWFLALIALFTLQLSAQSNSTSASPSVVTVIRAGTLIDPLAN